MSGNRLTSLAGIEAAKNLTSFTAAQNQIQSLNISGTQSSLKELSLSGNALKNLEGVNQFKALENLDISNNTITYIDLSHNFIPESELELNENRIPKALAQHFPAVKGGSIENNPLSEEKKEEKEASKQEDTAKSVDTNEAKSSPVRGINCRLNRQRF